jgi:hypothetical protein
MYFNIKSIENIIEKMKCDLGNKIWDNFMRKEYSLNITECSQESLEELELFLPIMEAKLLLLKNFQKGNNYYSYPSRLCKTDIDSFWNAENILKDCDNSILDKFKEYGLEKNLLSTGDKPCNNC